MFHRKIDIFSFVVDISNINIANTNITEDYLPLGKECEGDPNKDNYNPCKDGWYCAGGDQCNYGGLDCCRPKMKKNRICNNNRDCQEDLYCEDKKDFDRHDDLCRPVPNIYSHLEICDDHYDCSRGVFCDHRNCPHEFHANCCGGKFNIYMRSKMVKTINLNKQCNNEYNNLTNLTFSKYSNVWTAAYNINNSECSKGLHFTTLVDHKC